MNSDAGAAHPAASVLLSLRDWALAVFRVAFALATLAAIVAAFTKANRRDDFNPVNFFSFFTIESNLFAALVFLAGAGAIVSRRRLPHFEMIRGAAVCYMTTTGIIYISLLAGLEEALETTDAWVNFTLHYLMPLVVIVDWVLDRPDRAIPFKRALLWIVFPIAYLFYSLIRGAFTDWYPYPFIDPEANEGYFGVAVTSVAITLGFIAMVWVIAHTSGHRTGEAE